MYVFSYGEKMKYLIFIVIFLLIQTAHAQHGESQGISFSFTRVVYSDTDSKGVSFKAKNATTEPLLIQAWGSHIDPTTGGVATDRDTDSVPFIVLPPLQRVEPGEDFSLQLRPNGKPLAMGQESVFLLSFKSIPVSLQQKENNLALTVVTNLKVFARNHINNDIGITEAISKVQASWKLGEILIDNPTPYWLTLSSMFIDNNEIEKSYLLKMVAPMQKTTYSYSGKKPNKVTLRFIDEYSMDTPPITIKIK